jgi:hypothetical protein
MEKEAENRGSIKDIPKPISYFIAGSFLIWAILSSKSTSGVIGPMGWFTCIVGALLIIAGVISLVIIPFGKRIPKNFKRFFESESKYLDATVFAITLTALAATVIGFHDYRPLFIIGIVFLLVVVVMVTITSWSIFKDVVSLLTLTLSLNALAIVILFTGANNIQLATVLGLSFLFLALALNRMEKRAKSQ